MLIDAPPPLEVSDVLPLLAMVDAIVIVARVGHTGETSAQRLVDLLARAPQRTGGRDRRERRCRRLTWRRSASPRRTTISVGVAPERPMGMSSAGLSGALPRTHPAVSEPPQTRASYRLAWPERSRWRSRWASPLEVPNPNFFLAAGIAVGALGLFTLAASTRYEVTLALLMLYFGLLDGPIKLESASQRHLRFATS